MVRWFNDEWEALDYAVNLATKTGSNIDRFEIHNRINRYQKNRIVGVELSPVVDMLCITFLLASEADRDEEEWYPFPMAEDYGTGWPCAFCYVLNLDYPEFSEFGDCFFMNDNGNFNRIS